MSETPLSGRQFGERWRSALGSGPSRVTLAAQRARLISSAELVMSARFAPKRHLWAWGALGLAAASLFLVLTWTPADETIRATFNGAPVAERAQLETTGNTSQALEFSDGSAVTLGSQTRAEVSRLTPKTADLRLNKGRIQASIRKSTGLTWTIAVGPYQVRVVGTRFTVDWDHDERRLRVAVSEGRVRVFGGDLPGTGVAIDGGAQLERRYNQKVSSAMGEVGEPDRSADKLVDRSPTEPSTPGASSVTEPSWLTLATKGKYRQALTAAEKQGFDQLAASVPENDLVLLANSARFSGDTARARVALLKLRQRFPGRPAAQLGALYLARVSEDLERKPTEAVRWLRVFLQESPTGDLAASARTSLMAILLGQGDRAGALSIAEDYVRYHPDGPHVGKARALIAQNRHR